MLAQRLPTILDRLDADVQRSKENAHATQEILAKTREHVQSVMGDRATLPHLDLETPGSGARNGELMQTWLRDLSEVLPELVDVMESDMHELEGVVEGTGTSAH